MSTILTAEQCRLDLSLASEDPDFTLQAGRVEELFQRDLDLERVEEIATQFLSPKNPISMPFFNSLTVALMFHGPGKDVAPAQSSIDQFPISRTYGAVRVSWSDPDECKSTLPKTPSFGLLYWNRRGVKAVAIDGQHRLAAIRRAAELYRPDESSICVPVLFLLLNQEFGLSATGSQTSIMRQLFIDLNKHAQKVSRARQLLLDDREPLALAIRNTIGADLAFEPTAGRRGNLPIGTCGEFVSRMPLELVDWHGEQRAKVDRGPYAVSVLGLEWCYKTLCSTRRFGKRFVDMSKLQANAPSRPDDDYFTRVKKLVSHWNESVPGLADELKNAEDEDRFFMPSPERLAEMGQCISDYWGEAIVTLFSQAGPYYKLASYRVDKKLLSSEFGTWVQASEARAAAGDSTAQSLVNKLSAIENSLEGKQPGTVRAYRQCVEYINDSIKQVSSAGTVPEPHLLFSLTGQRAMIVALSELAESVNDGARPMSALASELEREAPTSQAGEVSLCAELLSESITWWNSAESGLMFTKACMCPRVPKLAVPDQFWHASIIKRDALTEIDYSGIAAIRGGRTLFVLCAAWMFAKVHSVKDLEQALREVERWIDTKKSPTDGLLNSSCSGGILKVALVQYFGVDMLREKSNQANKFPIAFAARGLAAGKGGPSDEQFGSLAKSRMTWIIDRLRQVC